MILQAKFITIFAQILMLTAILLSLKQAQVSALTSCNYRYPRSIGDNTGTIKVRGLDIDPAGNIAVGFSSTANTIKGSAFSYFDSLSQLIWVKYAVSLTTSAGYTIHGVKFQKSSGVTASTRMVGYFGDGTNQWFIFFGSDGSEIFQQQETTGAIVQSTYQNSIFYDSSGLVGFAMYISSTNKYMIGAFSPGSASSVYGFTVPSGFPQFSSGFGYAAIPGTQTGDYYFASTFKYSNNSVFETITRVSIGSVVATYRLDGGSFEALLSAIDVVESTSGTQTIVGCGYTKTSSWSSNHRLQLVMVNLDMATNAVISQMGTEQSGYYNAQCMDAKYYDSTTFYASFIEMQSQSDTYLVKLYDINMGATNAKQQVITASFDYMQSIYRSLIQSSYELLYGGSYYDYSVYSEIGIFLSSNQDLVCSTDMPTPSSNTNTITTFSSKFFFLYSGTSLYSSASLAFTATSFTWTAATAAYITQMSIKRKQNCAAATYTFDTVGGATTYSVASWLKQNGDFSFDMDTLFTGDESCSDKTRLYTLTPSGTNVNTYSISSSHMLFVAQSSLVQTAATDRVDVQCLFLDGSTKTITLTITIQDCSVNQITRASAFTNENYVIGYPSISQSLSGYTKQKSYCGNPTISISASPAITPSNALSWGGGFVYIYSTNKLSEGVYTVTVKYTNPINSANFYTFTFLVTITCFASITAVQITPAQPVLSYYMNGTFNYDLTPYFTYTNNCSYTFRYEIEMTNGSALPDFINPLLVSNTYQVFAVHYSFIGEYEFRIKAILNDALLTQNTAMTWKLRIFAPIPIVNTDYASTEVFFEKPKFKLNAKLSASMKSFSQLDYNLPEIAAQNLSNVEVIYNLGTAKTFTVIKNQLTLKFSPEIYWTEQFTIKIRLRLKDQPDIYTDYELKLLVTTDPYQRFEGMTDYFKSDQYFNTLTLEEQEYLRTFNADIISISVFGDLWIRVNQDLTFNETSKTFLDAKLILYLDTYLQLGQVISNWTIISYENRYIYIKIVFNNNELVSSYVVPDRIRVELVRHFKTYRLPNNRKLIETWKFRDKNYLEISAPIPNQVNKHQEEDIKAYSKLLEAFLFLLLIEAVFLSIMFEKQIYRIWNFWSSLQLIISLPLINPDFPSIVLHFNSFVIVPANLNFAQIVTGLNGFGLLGSDWHNNREDDSQISLNRSMLKYDSIYILAMLQNFTIISFLSSFILLLLFLYNKSKNYNKGRVYQFHQAIKYFDCSKGRQFMSYFNLNFFLRLCLLFHLQSSILCFLVFFDYNKTETDQQRFNIVQAIFTLAFAILLPAFAFYNIQSLQTWRVTEDQVKQAYLRFGTLFENFDIKVKYFSSFYLITFLRKIFYGLFLCWFPFQIQVAIQMSLTYLYLWFLYKYRPIPDQVEYQLVSFNEVCYIAALVLTLITSQIQLSYLIKFYFGCIYIALVSFFILVNFGKINIEFYKHLSRRIKCKKQILDTTSKIQFNTTEQDMNPNGQTEPKRHNMDFEEEPKLATRIVKIRPQSPDMKLHALPPYYMDSDDELREEQIATRLEFHPNEQESEQGNVGAINFDARFSGKFQTSKRPLFFVNNEKMQIQDL